MKAGWFFCFSDYDPITMVLQPKWPSGFTPTTLQYTLYDLRRLDKDVAPYDHVHQVMGTIAFVNDDVGDGHYHYVQSFNNNWQQVTVGATDHTHPFQVGGINDVRFLPDFFILFVSAEDAEFDVLVNDNQWYLIGEAAVSIDPQTGAYVFGDIDSTPFTQQEFDDWANRLSVALGRDMPTQITNPYRLVSWVCPMSAPNMYDWWNESLFRPTSR